MKRNMSFFPFFPMSSFTVPRTTLSSTKLALVANFRKLSSSSFLWFFICIVSITTILYWRRPDAFYNPQFWAEDGNYFFTNAFFLGVKSFLIPLSGYYHTLARLVAWIGSWMPVRYAPRWYELASWAMLVSIIGYIFSARFPLRNELKYLLGLALVATTVENEVFFNLANWATITSLFWLLLAISKEPQSRIQYFFDSMLLVLAGLNSPFVICLWPIFLLRWRVRRTTFSLYLFIFSLFITLIQIWNMLVRVREGGVFPTITPIFADVIVYRFGFMFLGVLIYKLQLANPLRILGLIVVIGFYGCLFWQAARTKNWPMLTILGGGMLTTILSFYVMRHALDVLIHISGRHFFIPTVTLAWALLLSDFKRWYIKWPPLAIIFVAFLFFTPSNKNQVLPDLDWAGQTALCTGTQPLCKIPINPVWDPPRWFAYMDSHIFTEPAVQTTFYSRFGDQIELLGYDFAQSHSELTLKLVWRARGIMKTDYIFFIHLYDPDNPSKIMAQEDAAPLGGQYPTSKWLVKEIILDHVDLSLARLRPGQYRIAVGWYDPNSPTMDRLTAHDSQERNWEDNNAVLPLTVVIPYTGVETYTIPFIISLPLIMH
jgi:hypothetical protein